MATVKAKRLSAVKGRNQTKRELYATVCYYYAQYTLKDAQALPARDLNLLISTAQKIEAMRMHNLTQIAAAPHTKDGKGVKKLLDHFKGQAA